MFRLTIPGWTLVFRLGSSLFGRKVKLYSNFPSAEKRFARQTYQLLTWDNPAASDDMLSCSLKITQSGSFHYYIECDDEYVWEKGWDKAHYCNDFVLFIFWYNYLLIIYQAGKTSFRFFGSQPRFTMRWRYGPFELHTMCDVLVQELGEVQRLAEKAGGGQRMWLQHDTFHSHPGNFTVPTWFSKLNV